MSRATSRRSGSSRATPIGYFHIDIAEVRTEHGKLHMFVAIDRTSKFAFVELHGKATTAVSREFLLRLIEAVPYKIHTVLTDYVLSAERNGACSQGLYPPACSRCVMLVKSSKQAASTGKGKGLVHSKQRVRTEAALTVLNTSF